MSAPADTEDDFDLETEKFLQLLTWTVARGADTDSVDSPDNEQGALCPSECSAASGVTAEAKRQAYQEIASTANRQVSLSEDVFDGGWFKNTIGERTATKPQLTHGSDLPYIEKSDEEKDELHLYVASVLNDISEEVVREHGAKHVTSKTTVEQFLFRAIDYDSFANAVSELITVDTEVQQLALFYRLTSNVIAMASTTEVSQNLMRWTKSYYRQKVAPWITKNQGLEKCVEAAAATSPVDGN